MAILRGVLGYGLICVAVLVAQSSDLYAAVLPLSTPEAVSSASAISGNNTAAFTLRKSVCEVRLEFNVNDRTGRSVNGLSPSEFVITDNGENVTEFMDFHSEANLPMRVAILIDSSFSTADELPFEKEVALRFVDHLLQSQDQALLGGFANRLRLKQGFTNDRALLREGIEALTSAGLTGLNDALFDLVEEHFEGLPNDLLSRKVLIVITDGEDTYSHRPIEDAIEIATRESVSIYSIAVQDRSRPLRDATGLEMMARITGGRNYYPKKLSDLDRVFAQIATDLRSYYTASYRLSAGSSGFHRVRVRTAHPAEWSVRARAGYFAESLTPSEQ